MSVFGGSLSTMNHSLSPEGHHQMLISEGDAAHEEDETQSNRHNSRKRVNRSAADYPRKRASQACFVCRARKSRCDNERPSCGFCKKSGTQCQYPSTELSTIDASSLLILDRVAHVEARLSDQISELQRQLHQSARDHVPEDSAVSFRLDQSLQSRNTQGTYDGMNGDTIMCWPVVQTLLQEIDETAAWSSSSRCQHLSPSILLEATPTTLVRSRDSDESLTFFQRQELIASYFAHVHSKSPIFDDAWFREIQAELIQLDWSPCYYSGPSSIAGSSPTKVCIYLLVLALGYLVGIESNHSPDKPLEQSCYFDYALSWSGPSMCEQRTNSSTDLCETETNFHQWTERIQCLLLMGTYFMWIMRPWDAKRVFGEAAALTKAFLQLFDNRAAQDPNLRKNISPEFADLRLRVCWAAVKAESEVQEEFSASISPEWSSISRFIEYEGLPEPPLALKTLEDPTSPSITSQTWFYYLAEIASRKILNRISNELYRKLPSSPSLIDYALIYPVAKELEAQIQEWSTSLPQHVFDSRRILSTEFGPNTPPRKYDLSLELAQHLENRQFQARIATFRPFLQALATGNWSGKSDEAHEQVSTTDYHKTVIEAAFQCVLICIEFLEAQGAPRRHFGTWRRGRAIWAAALSVLAAVMIPALRNKMAYPHNQRTEIQYPTIMNLSLITRAEEVLGSAAAWLYEWKDESPSLLLGAKIIWEALASAQRRGLFVRGNIPDFHTTVR